MRDHRLSTVVLASFCNYNNLPYQLNLPIDAIEMTAYVYDPCVRNDQYGQWANVWYELVLVHMPIIPTPPTNPWHNKIRIEDVRQFLEETYQLRWMVVSHSLEQLRQDNLGEIGRYVGDVDGRIS